MTLHYESDAENIRQRLTIAHDSSQAIIRGDFFDAEYDFFGKFVVNQRVLVAGSGLGHDAFILSKNNKTVVGVELLSLLVKSAQETAQKMRLSHVLFEQGDFTQLTYPDNSFDVSILNMGTIGNFENKESVIKELLRVAAVLYFDFILHHSRPSKFENRCMLKSSGKMFELKKRRL